MEHTASHYTKKLLPSAWLKELLFREQRKIFQKFVELLNPRPTWRVLDVGANGDAHIRAESYFENLYPYPRQLCAAGLEQPDRFQRLFPEIQYVQLRRSEKLPFKDGEFDAVYCSAVIEHVGSSSAQRDFLAELFRVGRRGFVTTPNRWFPVELHTVVPLVHYLPHEVYRAVYRRLGFHFFAQEANLNLLDAGELRALLPRGQRADVNFHYFFGMPSNVLLSWGNAAV